MRPNQQRHFNYPVMETHEIFTLLDKEIFIHTTDNPCVFMWTIDKYLIDAAREMLRRGYKLHCRFIWDKTNGTAPAFTVRFSHEYLLWFYKSPMMPISKTVRGKYTTIIRKPSRQHSRKPDAAYRMIQDFYPQQTICDVFSREKRDGISQWGNECGYF